MNRTLAKETVGREQETVTLKGWVNARRNMGKIAFIDLRDRSAIVQVVFVPAELDEASKAVLNDLRPEFCVEITGVVQARSAKQINPDMTTGTVEILAKSLIILNAAKTPPFELDKDTSGVNEELRLKY